MVHHVVPAAPITSFQLNLATPYAGDTAEIAAAAAVAAGCDAAVVVVGTTEETESEGFDRKSLALPGRQDELVRAVLQANPRTVVVVNSGAPVLMPWLADAPAVLLTWFGGQESGNALADMLLGIAEPGGRLPTTWPATERGLASPEPVDGILDYAEGIAVGYRAGPSEGLPFGHGLGYTTWDYLGAQAAPADDGAVTVRVRLRNTGDRAGREVVQVYLSRPVSAVERPARWLAGFATVDAQPGQRAEADVVLARRAFEHWDCDTSQWQVEPGEFSVHIGRSSAADALRMSVTVDRQSGWVQASTAQGV
jgi:beta-glucosidase